MTTYSVQRAAHRTLVSATEDIVNLAGPSRTVTITNWGAVTDVITFRIAPIADAFGPGAVAPTAATTAAGTNDDFQLRGAAGSPVASITFEVPSAGGVTVRLISTQTPAYSVQSIPSGVR